MKNKNEVEPLTWIEYLSFSIVTASGYVLYQLPNIKKLISSIVGDL